MGEHMTTERHPWPVIGHPVAVEILRRAALSGHPSHAYLLAGPEGVGRRTLALAFAQALACAAPPAARPCGDCSACRRIARGIYPDVTLVSLATQAASSEKADAKHTRISIDTVRELRASLALRPLEGAWRVAIVDDADRLSRDAYDALLKTLEEPPPFVVLVLIATEAEAVPETIRSRCQQIALEPVPRAEVAAALAARGLDPDQAATIASVTRGRIGHAIALAADEQALAASREAVETGLEMIETPLRAVGGARRLAEAFRRGQRDQVERQLDTLLGLWRDLLLIASGCPDQIVNADVRDRLTALAGRWRLPEIHRGLKATHQALFDLAANVQPRLALVHMVMEWPGSDG